MKSNPTACGYLALIILLAPALAMAQYPSQEVWKPAQDKTIKPSGAAAAVAYWTSKHKRVRLSVDDQRLETRSVNLEQGYMTIAIGDESIPVYYDQIHKVEYRGSAWRKGGLIGGIVYGALNLIAAIDLHNNGELDGAEVGLAAALGFGAGYIAGALIGAPFKQWNTVYEVERPNPSTSRSR